MRQTHLLGAGTMVIIYVMRPQVFAERAKTCPLHDLGGWHALLVRKYITDYLVSI
jgi:hypothetical protein